MLIKDAYRFSLFLEKKERKIAQYRSSGSNEILDELSCTEIFIALHKLLFHT